jgi:hypothetical protein
VSEARLAVRAPYPITVKHVPNIFAAIGRA